MRTIVQSFTTSRSARSSRDAGLMREGIISHRQFVATIGSVSFVLSIAAVLFNGFAYQSFYFPRSRLNYSIMFPAFVLVISILMTLRPNRKSAALYFIVVICASAYINVDWGRGLFHVSPQEERIFEQRTFAADAFFVASVAAAFAAFPSVYILGFRKRR